MSKKYLILLAVLLSSIAEASETTSISENEREYVGLLAGGSSNQNGGQNMTAFGATLGGQVTRYLGVGIFGSRSEQTNSNFSVLTTEMNFYLGNFHFGPEGGFSWTTPSGANSTVFQNNTTASVVLGPQAGYDFKVARAFSIGAEAHYLIIQSQNKDSTQALVSLKYWFQ